MKFAYVGSRTTKQRNARGEGISVYTIDDNEQWKLIQKIKVEENPSFLCFDNNKEYLYAVHGDLYSVSSYKIDKETGVLTHLNTVKSGGRNPVFLTPDETNKFLFIASLQGGAVATLLRKPDGSVTDPMFTEHLEGITEEGVSHAHQCIKDRSQKFIAVPTQGRNVGYGGVFVYRINYDGGLIRTQRLISRDHDEPRHMVFDNTNKFAYVLNEHGNCITTMTFDDENGILSPVQIVSTLPETYTGNSKAGEIVIHPNNKFIYSTNRSHNSVAVFERNEENGFIKMTGCTDCLGKIPRFMEISDDGKKLYVANEESDTIQIFAVNEKDGSLEFTNNTINTGSPVCIIFKEA